MGDLDRGAHLIYFPLKQHFFKEQLVFIIIDFISDMPCGIVTYSSALFLNLIKRVM